MMKPGDFRVVNHSVPRTDGNVKVTGRALFSGDIVLPEMLHAKLLRSTYAHARILAIDSSEALEQPGVVAVLTGADLEGIDPYYGHAVKDHPLLALDKVRFCGEPVAAVIATDERSAYEALEEIEVEYEELPAAMDVDQALAPDGPRIHEQVYQAGKFRGFEEAASSDPTNICQQIHYQWGDPEAAFADAAHVVEGEFHYPKVYAYAMEPYTSVADYNAGGLTVYSCAQHPFMVRADLAAVFGLPLNQVRVISPYIGGGYGSKSYTKVEPVTAACSWSVGRPVRLALSVNESILTTRADSARVRIRTAVDGKGALLAREATIHLDTGAYAENSPLVCKAAANRIVGPYRIPHVKVSAFAVYTNTGPASSFRGFGATQVSFPGESQIDELAEKTGMDPVQFRLQNLAGPGERTHPGTPDPAPGQKLLRPLDADLPADVRMLEEILQVSGEAPAGTGRAVGCSASDAGARPISSAVVHVYTDDSVSVLAGTTEMGQGGHTVMAQIAAEEMGVSLDRVRVISSDTGIVPFDRSTGASRSTTVVGRAVMGACREAIQQMIEMAAEVWGVDAGQVSPGSGGVSHGEKQLSWGEVLRCYSGISGFNVVGRAYVRKTGELEELPVFWEIGCSGVELSVDRETGRIQVEQLATVGDVGLAINPAMAEGQDLGAATMGLGIGLYEELLYEGQELVNGSLLDYRVPRFSDLPRQVHLLLAQRQDGVGPYGAKGGGEGALNPIPATLANALYRATGVRMRRLPLTPERVWNALQEAGAASRGKKSD